MKLWACLIFYRDGVELLERCLSSLKKNGVDEIIAVDGRYKEFPEKGNNSTQKELELVIKYVDVWGGLKLSKIEGWDSQIEKRNASIKPVPVGDYFLVIDADEVLASPIDKSLLTGDSYSVQMFEPKPGTESSVENVFKNCFKQYPSNRIYKKYDDMEYRNRHCAIYRTSLIKDPSDVHSGLVSRDLSIPFIYSDGLPVTLYHYPYKRSSERQLADAIYMENRQTEIAVPFKNLDFNTRPIKEDVELVHVKFVSNSEMKVYRGVIGDFEDGDTFYCQKKEYNRLVRDFGMFTFRRMG